MKRLIAWLLIFLSLVGFQTKNYAQKKSQKLKVEQIIFVGNHQFSDRQLLRTMITRPSTLFSKSYYFENIFEDDLKSLLSFYQRSGFLEATVVDKNVKINTSRKSVVIKIEIDEGKITTIEAIDIFGNNYFDETKLSGNTKLKENDPFKQEKIQQAKIALLTLYANEGFLDAVINPEIKSNLETHRAMVDFMIDEKVQYKIDKINIQGLVKTKTNIVKRELLFKSDQVVSYTSLLKTQRNLYLTGLFQSVFIRPQPAASGDSTAKDILIEIKENQSGEFNVAVGYGSVERLRGRIEIYNANLAGTARKIGLTTKISFVNRAVESSFSDPYMLGVRLRTDLNFKYDFIDEPSYDLNRIGGRITIGKSFFYNSNISLNYRHERTKLRAIKVVDIPEKLISNVRSLTLSTIYDGRDNMFNTNRGIYLEWSNELAGAFLSGSNTFVRTVFRAKFFKSLTKNAIIGTSFETGWMDVFGQSKDIPLYERFYAGGPNSMRGFKYRSIGPLDVNNVSLGGNFKIIWNVFEIRQVIYKMIGGVIFMDVGNVWRKSKHCNFADLRWSPGAGIRVNTPLGIMRIDYGFNIRPQKWEPSGMFYFNMGQVF